MGPWGGEFSECLAVLLDGRLGPLPEPEGDGQTFWRQWLAGHNLGLVPIAAPAEFAWPGHWIAFAGDGSETRAVLMFGSPSGPVEPDGILARGGKIEAGWLLAQLDLHRGWERAYAGSPGAGTVEAILLAPDAEAPLARVPESQALAGRGLDGDRYAAGRGTFAGGKGYDLTLIEAEALEALGAEAGIALPWADARRNLVTRGIRLNALVGQRFRVGEVECVGRRLAEPCSHLERLTEPGVLRGLVHRAGLRADILTDGTIRQGDAVRAEP